MGSSVVSPEEVLGSLMNDGTIDAIRLKIINQLKTNEELRNNTITMVEESRVLSTPGAEKQTKRELFEALRAELETQALEMASKAVWELILDNNGLGKEINETVEEVFCRLNGCKAPPFPTHPPQHQQPMPPPPPPLQPPQQQPPQQQPPQQQPQPPTLLQQFSKQQQPPLPQLLQQLLQQQQHGALPPPFQPPAQLQHPPLAPLPQLPLQHFPQQAPIPTQLQHPPLAPLPQLPLQRLQQQQQLPPPLHQLPQQQYPQLSPQPPLPPQLQEQPPPPPPSPPPPQPPPPSPPSPMHQPPPPFSMQQPSPPPQQHLFPSLQFLTADAQIENAKDSEEREEGEKVYDIEMTESSSPKRAFSELNMQGAALVGNGDTEIPTVTSSETEMPSMDP